MRGSLKLGAKAGSAAGVAPPRIEGTPGQPAFEFMAQSPYHRRNARTLPDLRAWERGFRHTNQMIPGTMPPPRPSRRTRPAMGFLPRPGSRLLGVVLVLIGFLAPNGGGLGSSALTAMAATSRLPAGPANAVLWVRLEGCLPGQIPGACQAIPDLVVELDPGTQDAQDLKLTLKLGSQPVECPAPRCAVALAPTPVDGIEFTFWATDLAGRRGVVYSGSVRVRPVADPRQESDPTWYVQVLSPQWEGDPVDACAVDWDSFPPVPEPPVWLAQPDDASSLTTQITYHQLGAHLIETGLVDAGSCADGGLQPGGVLSACGAQVTQPAIVAWENQFDPIILESAQRLRVPAALIKGIIAEESQFWPGTNVARGEYGLGHLTELGADNTLLWNPSFYFGYCPTILGDSFCNLGYARQSDYRRGLLKGSLLAQVDADCPACDGQVDLDKAAAGIPILAQTLRAYCSQTGRMVWNVTGAAPGQAGSYEDLWRLTLANYAGGAGCLTLALKATDQLGLPLTWEDVSSQIPEACSGSRKYVEDVAGH